MCAGWRPISPFVAMPFVASIRWHLFQHSGKYSIHGWSGIKCNAEDYLGFGKTFNTPVEVPIHVSLI